MNETTILRSNKMSDSLVKDKMLKFNLYAIEYERTGEKDIYKTFVLARSFKKAEDTFYEKLYETMKSISLVAELGSGSLLTLYRDWLILEDCLEISINENPS